MTRFLDWNLAQDISVAKNILWFAYRQLPNVQNAQLESRISTLEKSVLHAQKPEPIRKFKQSFNFGFQNTSVVFVFNVDLANTIAQHKQPLIISKSRLKSTPSFIYDREADGTKGTSKLPIILAPLFGSTFVLDGNHRFNNTNSDSIQKVDLSYSKTANTILSPVAQEFYLLLHQIYYWKN